MSDRYELGEPVVIYEGQFIELLARPFFAGTWEYTRRKGAVDVVFVLAITPEDEVLLVRQFRVPLGREVWELPAGLGDHEGEDPTDCAQRELVEETGWRAGRTEMMMTTPISSGGSAVRGDIILAMDLEYVGRSGGDEFFPIEVHRVPFSELGAFVVDLAQKGEMVDARILAALKLAEMRLGR